MKISSLGENDAIKINKLLNKRYVLVSRNNELTYVLFHPKFDHNESLIIIEDELGQHFLFDDETYQYVLSDTNFYVKSDDKSNNLFFSGYINISDDLHNKYMELLKLQLIKYNVLEGLTGIDQDKYEELDPDPDPLDKLIRSLKTYQFSELKNYDIMTDKFKFRLSVDFDDDNIENNLSDPSNELIMKFTIKDLNLPITVSNNSFYEVFDNYLLKLMEYKNGRTGTK